jgi:hypothetical protein
MHVVKFDYCVLAGVNFYSGVEAERFNIKVISILTVEGVVGYCVGCT